MEKLNFYESFNRLSMSEPVAPEKSGLGGCRLENYYYWRRKGIIGVQKKQKKCAIDILAAGHGLKFIG